jgi:arginyl-tRNA synthetase
LSPRFADSERVGIEARKRAGKVIVDYSSPNVAKEMHVGHLRSTIIGDTIKRHLQFLGHEVLGLNHVGDWGTAFGMLIVYMGEIAPDGSPLELGKPGLPRAGQGPSARQALVAGDQVELGDLVVFYKKSKARFDASEEFQHISRAEVVKLQSGDAKTITCWKLLVATSATAFNEIYGILDVRDLQLRGESFYNPMLQATVDTLVAKGMTETDDGVICVPIAGQVNKEGKPFKFPVQKSGGGFLYATTDLAAVQHRVTVEKAARVIYCVDTGQAKHFEHVFSIAARADWIGDCWLQHVPFGLVQGEDGAKLKTRSGETPKLKDLLATAVTFANAMMLKRYTEELDGEKTPDAERAAWLTARVTPYGDRVPQIIAAFDEVQTLAEGEKEWADKRDEIQALLVGGEAWLQVRRAWAQRGSVHRLACPLARRLASPGRDQGAVGRQNASNVVGLGSVKFADLQMTRTNDYRFSYKKMLQMQGKAFPNMLYQFVRIKSIARKVGGNAVADGPGGTMVLSKPCVFILVKPAEMDLAKHLLDFSRTLLSVERELYPDRTCEYLFQLAQLFSKFYGACSVRFHCNENIAPIIYFHACSLSHCLGSRSDQLGPTRASHRSYR